MLRHVVLIQLVTDDPEHPLDSTAQALIDGLRALPGQIPEIRSYTVGRDLGLAPGNAHVAVLAEFDDAEALQTYRDHPAHVDVVQRLIEPVSTSRTAVQFEV